MVFNFNLGSLPAFDLPQIVEQLKLMNDLPGNVPTLFFSSHDMPRMISRFGEFAGDIARARAVACLQLMAHGVPFIYNGEEVGMQDYVATEADAIYDIQGRTQYQQKLAAGGNPEEAFQFALTKSRDNSRSPMQWSAAPLPVLVPTSRGCRSMKTIARSMWRLRKMRAIPFGMIINNSLPCALNIPCFTTASMTN